MSSNVSMANKAELDQLVRKEYASVIVGGRERNSEVFVGKARLEPVENKKTGKTVMVRRAGTTMSQPLGWMTHPIMDYLSPDWRLSKVTYDRKDESPQSYCETTIARHTLSWCRGEGTVFADLNNEDGTKMTQKEMYDILGVVENFRSPAKWGKRVSRILSVQYKPAQYGIFAPNSFKVVESRILNEKAWDGAIVMSRADFNRLLMKFQFKEGTPQAVIDASVKEMVKYNRFSLTLITDGQQFKGHLLVLDYLPDTGEYTLYTHEGAGKREFAFTNLDFFGVQAVKGHAHMDLDRQSLINLYDFFGVENLVKWLEAERDEVIEAIKTNKVVGLLDRTGAVEKKKDLDKLGSWLLASYATAGGNVMWFKSMVRQAGRTYLEKLGHGRLDGMRLPIPGGRMYIYTDSVFVDVVKVAYEHVGADAETVQEHLNAAIKQFELNSGTIRVLEEYSAIIVPSVDWDEISEISGGADHDDGYWLFGFEDTDGVKKVLFWRSPNARGEYLVAVEDGQWFKSYPKMDSAKLPPRIDTLPNEWLDLPREDSITNFDSYNPYRLIKEIERSVETMGHLGMFVLATSYEAWLNESTRASYRQEVVVDGTQKDGLDTSLALENIKSIIIKRVLHEKAPVSPIIYGRIAWCFGGLSWDELLESNPNINVTNDSWLDHLMEAVAAQIEIFNAQLDTLSREAFPPVELFVAGQSFVKQGAELSASYAKICEENNQDGTPDWDAIRQGTERKLAGFGEDAGNALLGAAAHIYAMSAERDNAASDSLLWLMGGKDSKNGGRLSGVGNMFIEMLQNIGLLSRYSVVENDEVYSHIEVDEFVTTTKPVAITITGGWYSLLKAQANGQAINFSKVTDATKAKLNQRLQEIAPKMAGIDIELRLGNVNNKPALLAYSVRTGAEIGVAHTHQIPQEMFENKKLNIKFIYCTAHAKQSNLVCVCA